MQVRIHQSTSIYRLRKISNRIIVSNCFNCEKMELEYSKFKVSLYLSIFLSFFLSFFLSLRPSADKKNLSAEFIWGENNWGIFNKKTNTWSGMVAKVVVHFYFVVIICGPGYVICISSASLPFSLFFTFYINRSIIIKININ